MIQLFHQIKIENGCVRPTGVDNDSTLPLDQDIKKINTSQKL